MFNNTSSFEYYNYGNFEKKHAPPNVAYQRKKLIPELEAERAAERAADKISVDILAKPDDIPMKEPGIADNIGETLMSFFKKPIITPPPPEPIVPIIPSAPIVPVAAPAAAPVPGPRGLAGRATLPGPVPGPVPGPGPGPVPVKGIPTSPAPPVPPLQQLGGGEYNMDMHSLMRKNRMLNARVLELEKDLYLSKRR